MATVLLLAGCGGTGAAKTDASSSARASVASSAQGGGSATPASADRTWGPFEACPDLSRLDLPAGVLSEPPEGGGVRCSYSGTPTVIVEYHPDGYAGFRKEVFDLDYSQGGGAQDWPAFGARAVRSSSGDESFGSCSFLLPSTSPEAYVVVSTALDPGTDSYCDAAEKAAEVLSPSSSAGTASEAAAPVGVQALPPATSRNFGLTFDIAEHPYSYPVQVTTSRFTLSNLTLRAEAVRSGDRVTITVTPSARGRYTLVSSPHGFSVFRREVTASPLWKKGSVFCREAIPTESDQPLADVIVRQAVAPIGISTASSYAELQRYPSAPFCGLNWQGYPITGANEQLRNGDSLELRGADASFDVVTSPDLAEEVMRQALAPAGWAFVYGEQPDNAPQTCPDIATGTVGYSTVDLC